MELISRQAAIEALRVAYWDDKIQSAKDDPCIVDAMTDWAIRQVKALPSAQPEIIRCKDCKKNPHWEWAGCPMTGKDTRKPDDFCSYAERRTDEPT